MTDFSENSSKNRVSTLHKVIQHTGNEGIKNTIEKWMKDLEKKNQFREELL